MNIRILGTHLAHIRLFFIYEGHLDVFEYLTRLTIRDVLTCSRICLSVSRIRRNRLIDYWRTHMHTNTHTHTESETWQWYYLKFFYGQEYAFINYIGNLRSSLSTLYYSNACIYARRNAILDHETLRFASCSTRAFYFWAVMHIITHESRIYTHSWTKDCRSSKEYLQKILMILKGVKYSNI